MQNHSAKTGVVVGSGSTDWRSESPQLLLLPLALWPRFRHCL